MPGSREIRNKIKSIKNTQKITKAMEMVAAAKMRKAQERTRTTRPYAARMLDIVTHLARANTEYKHPFLVKRDTVRRAGAIVVTTDKGLCGALNTNVLRMLLAKVKEWQGQGIECEFVAIGNKGLGFLQRMGATPLSHAVGLGDTPRMERLIGPVKVMLDAYVAGRVDEVHLFFNRFVNTMRQDPWEGRILPLQDYYFNAQMEKVESKASTGVWDYVYEPDARAMLDEVLTRYIEVVVYQGVAENMASEQSARMVAMKAASDNAGNLIDELTLIYNKARQAAITKEISEIVGGAAAVS
jgi:F-type H+-transporting ATPase subunit gamma